MDAGVAVEHGRGVRVTVHVAGARFVAVAVGECATRLAATSSEPLGVAAQALARSLAGLPGDDPAEVAAGDDVRRRARRRFEVGLELKRWWRGQVGRAPPGRDRLVTREGDARLRARRVIVGRQRLRRARVEELDLVAIDAEFAAHIDHVGGTATPRYWPR